MMKCKFQYLNDSSISNKSKLLPVYLVKLHQNIWRDLIKNC